MAEITEGLRRRHGIDESVVPAETVALGRSQSGLNAPRIAKRRGAQDQLFQQLIDAGNSIQFERIILEQMIGQGGMGKVFEARCRDSGQKLAVKFLHKAFQFDERAVRRFSCEAQAVMKLNHPGIVKIRGIGQTAGGVYFIAMDLIEGDDLKHTVRSSCMRQSIGWVIDIAAALQHAHEAGIVHCDLKPSNVRVTSGNRPVLMDFGLARLLDGQQSSQHAIAGTAPWMAPEQIDAAFGQIGPRTDVYGLAALLYTLLCGQPPFSGNRTPDVLSQVISAARPVPPSQFQSDLPPVINDICMQALSKQPADRPQSMQLMIAALTDGLTEIGDG
jgi:serine/threonine protein kinase